MISERGSFRHRVTAASSGTHTHAGAGSRRLAWRSLARPSLRFRRLSQRSGAPVYGSEKLPEGSRRDTGGVSVTPLL